MTATLTHTWLVAGALLLTAGCATARPPIGGAGPPAAPAAEYRLQRGDILDVKMFYAPELNENASIRPDGRISMQLIGEITAAGLTPSELAQTVRERYTGILLNPEATVIVRKFTGLKAYVAGEVTTPGLVSFDAPASLLQALIQAGWLKPTAQPRNVVIIRDTGTGVPAVHLVDVKKLIEEPETARHEILHPFDIVFVPKSTIATIQDFIDQYLDKPFLTPISRLAGFGFSYQLNGLVDLRNSSP